MQWMTIVFIIIIAVFWLCCYVDLNYRFQLM